MGHGNSIPNHGYKAWRNFILILTTLVVAKCISSFNEIKLAFISLTDFNKTFPQSYWPEMLSFFLIIYIIKNSHGLIITLFDDEYTNNLCDSRSKRSRIVKKVAFFYYLFTAAVVWSFSFSLQLLDLVPRGFTLEERSYRLMSLVFLPTIIFFIFDLLHNQYLFDKNKTQEESTLSILLKKPTQRVEHYHYKKIWIIEDIISVIISFLAILIINLTNTPDIAIYATIISIFLILVINSVLDYFLNCNYFFFKCIKKNTAQKKRKKEHTYHNTETSTNRLRNFSLH